MNIEKELICLSLWFGVDLCFVFLSRQHNSPIHHISVSNRELLNWRLDSLDLNLHTWDALSFKNKVQVKTVKTKEKIIDVFDKFNPHPTWAHMLLIFKPKPICSLSHLSMLRLLFIELPEGLATAVRRLRAVVFGLSMMRRRSSSSSSNHHHKTSY